MDIDGIIDVPSVSLSTNQKTLFPKQDILEHMERLRARYFQMFPWIAIGLLVLIIILLSYVLKWQRGRSVSHLPTYTYLPIFGTAYKLIGGPRVLQDRVAEISEKMEETNLPFMAWAGTTPVIVLQDPDDLKLVTNAFGEKPYIYDFGKIWVGDGIATVAGHQWKHDIKCLAKPLKRKSIKTYQEVFNAHAKKLVKKLEISTCNIAKQIAYTTFEIISIICAGGDIPDLIPIDEFHDAISGTFNNFIHRILNILYLSDYVYHWTKSYKELKKHTDVLHDVSEAILKNYKQNILLRKDENKSSNRNGSHKPRFRPLLSHLLDGRLSEEKIKSEIDTLIFAQEPLATALLMVFLMIGSRQDVQDKLHAEIKGIFGDSKRDVVKEDLEKMVYCEGVIREALRLYPPAPFVMRNIDQDFQIKSCTIPKNTLCLINIWGSGRSKRIWGSDVLEFRPERWIEPASSLPPILAFSMGKRGCIGEKYAYSLLKTMFAYAVRDLVFETDSKKLKMKMDVLLRVDEELETLKIVRREANITEGVVAEGDSEISNKEGRCTL